jgi:ferredoxin-thioredoxin reductase catalytic chain
MAEPKQESLDKMWKYVKGFAEKSGTTMHPTPAVTEAVVNGLAMHMDEQGRALKHKAAQSSSLPSDTDTN